MINRYKTKQNRRKQRTRARIARFSDRPRLSIFRSNKHIYAQIIENKTGKILAHASDLKMKDTKKTKVDIAFEVGKQVASQAVKNKVKTVVFDRGSYKYHGRVKAVCEGARENGLTI